MNSDRNLVADRITSTESVGTGRYIIWSHLELFSFMYDFFHEIK